MTNRALSFSIFFLILFKITAIYFTNFGLYGDEAQYWLWSKAIDLGYYSKPPLLAWFLFGHTSLFGDSFFSLKTFPIAVYFFISFAIYGLCVSLSFDKKNSWLCAISFLIIPATSLSSFLISTDLLLLLFWAISMVVLLKTISMNSTYNFLLLGIFLGLAFLAKYAAIYFLICLFLLLIIDKKTFSAFKNNPVGVLVFLLSFLLVLGPNVWWNFINGWITVSHTSDNANLENLNFNIYEPSKFLIAQIIMVGPFLFISFIFFIKYFSLDFENKFLLAFSMPVLFLVLVESFLVRANANWAAPALISVFIMFFRLVVNKKTYLIKINFFLNYFVAICLFASILISSESKVFSRINGINNFVDEVSEIINEKDLAVSDRIVFSNISYQLRKKQNRVFMPYEENTPISNHFQMSSPLRSGQKDTFFLLGNLNDVSYLSKKYQGKLIKEFDVIFSSKQLKLYEISFK